jgi:hypothetical protein
MADFRNIERSARTLPGVTVDREVLAHISGASTKTNPDILLQNTLQELMEAKSSADTTKKALLVRTGTELLTVAVELCFTLTIRADHSGGFGR